MSARQRAERELVEARQRTLALLDAVDDDALVAQHSKLMSPLVWDLAHIGHYEELWLIRALGRGGATDPRFDDVYDAFRHPRAERPALELLGPREARAFVASVRARAFEVLATVDLTGDDPLLEHGFVYGMVAQHEHQHDETMLATLQLRDAVYPLGEAAAGRGDPDLVGREVLVEGGPFTMGTDAAIEPWAYDNERPAHEVEVPSFRIDAAPVTNGAYAEFVASGGYDQARWWTDAGWSWRQDVGATHPEFWIDDRGAWLRRRFGRLEPLPPLEPVQHVCAHEAAAYARWRGRRLPTEVEWEKAAAWDPATGRTRRYPWGDQPPDASRANLGQVRFGPDPVGAHPAGVSPSGCHQMLGDVWEWTASDFDGYPGFVSFPYREYSEVFFGPDYRVLRGGSWATHPVAIRPGFRNWDFPIRRQIFAGFRCARDA